MDSENGVHASNEARHVLTGLGIPASTSTQAPVPNVTAQHSNNITRPNEPTRSIGNQNVNLNNQPGGLPQQQQRQNETVQDRLFYALFVRIALVYVRLIPPHVRRILEFGMFLKALVFFVTLVYVHVAFIRTPAKCLEGYKTTWPRHGILRVELLSNTDFEEENHDYATKWPSEVAKGESEYVFTEDSASSQMPSLEVTDVTLTAPSKAPNIYLDATTTRSDNDENDEEPPEAFETDTKGNEKEAGTDDIEDVNLFELSKNGNDEQQIDANISAPSSEQTDQNKRSWWSWATNHGDWIDTILDSLFGQISEPEPGARISGIVAGRRPACDYSRQPNDFPRVIKYTEEIAVIEYSSEFGFLRLSPSVRERLAIPMLTIHLDLEKEECFGGNFSRLLLDTLLGYDGLLMSSIKMLAEDGSNATTGGSLGYVRNVLTGEHFKFVSMSMTKSAYLAALLIMLIFTFSVSMLLRFAHHQLFVFIVQLLQMLEFNAQVAFPAAPLLTVILALVGMEAIMSEFFNDASTAFYIILTVWIADQYDAVCCHSNITKRYWLRFFYLYHSLFYAYHYRFNGQYGGLALVTSWLFIQHSMIYFFHHYELPLIVQQQHIHTIFNSLHQPGHGEVVNATAQRVAGEAIRNHPRPASQMGPSSQVERQGVAPRRPPVWVRRRQVAQTIASQVVNSVLNSVLNRAATGPQTLEDEPVEAAFSSSPETSQPVASTSENRSPEYSNGSEIQLQGQETEPEASTSLSETETGAPIET